MMGIVYSVYKILELFLTDCKRSGYDHDTPAMTLLPAGFTAGSIPIIGIVYF